MTSASTIEPKFLASRNELGIVAVGFSGGQCKPGVDAAPTALIDSGLISQLRDDLGLRIHHDGQVHSYAGILPPAAADPDHRGMKRPKAVSAVTRALARQVHEHASRGRFVLTLGGDHSIAIGTIGGSARAVRERLGRELAVIWVDAHADINTPETSASGNIHGMPVAFLTGLARGGEEGVFGWIREENRISPRKLVYIGLRDIDRGEKGILKENGIKAYSMHDIDRYASWPPRIKVVTLTAVFQARDRQGHGDGAGVDRQRHSHTPVLRRGRARPAMVRVPFPHLPHIIPAPPDPLIPSQSTGLVVLTTPRRAPSTGTPVRGGLTLREGDFIAECVHETGSLVALDLVEVNPSLEVQGASETIRAGCSIVRCALGDTLL